MIGDNLNQWETIYQASVEGAQHQRSGSLRLMDPISSVFDLLDLIGTVVELLWHLISIVIDAASLFDAF